MEDFGELADERMGPSFIHLHPYFFVFKVFYNKNLQESKWGTALGKAARDGVVALCPVGQCDESWVAPAPLEPPHSAL